MILGLVVLVLVQKPAPAAGRDSMAGRACQVVIDTVGHAGRQVEVRPGETNLFAGGGVRAHCRGTNSTLVADSLAWFAGVGRLDLLNGVQIRDTAVSIDAVTASYYLRQERLEAHKNVVAVSRATGTVLRGPNLTYYRVAAGVRDTSEMYATSRPTITYRTRPDSGEPYIIVADRVRMKGSDRVWAGGSVTIDRSDVAARGDSLSRDESKGLAVLLGKPEVRGKGIRSYRLIGRRIEMFLVLREVRIIKALGRGEATGADWKLTADTIYLMMGKGKLQQVVAWGDSSRPQALSSQNTIEADSLVLDAPDEVLTAARAYRDARSSSKRDTTADAEVNWIAGDTITARWGQKSAPSRPLQRSLDRLIARGGARAFTHLRNQRDSTAPPSLNYSRGAVIDIAMKGDKIDRVLVTGKADGMQLDPVPPPPPPPDSTKVTKPKGAK